MNATKTILLLFTIFFCSLFAQTFQYPLASPFTITSKYGEVWDGEYHLGIDLDNYTGAPVKSVAKGKATIYPVNGTVSTHGYGNLVIIEHFISPRIYTLYAHLDNINVSNGQIVEAGETIGTLGDTGVTYGAHLHFEVKYWKTIGTITNNNGSQYYSPAPEYPSLYGQMDPEPFFTKNIKLNSALKVTSSSRQTIYSKPGSGRKTLKSVEANIPLMAFATYDDWFLVHFPSIHGPACGWMQGVGSNIDQMCLIEDSERGTVGVSLRSGPSTNYPIVSYVWDQQRFIVKNETSEWVEIYTDSSIGGSSAWVSKKYASIYGTGGGGGGPGSPVMEYYSHRIDDDKNTSDGNDDGKVNPGETIELPVTLRNSGSSTAHNVKATLSSSSQYITITDDDRVWGDIPAGATEESSDFDFVVSSNCPPGYAIPFTLNITSDEGSWADTLMVTVYGSGGGGGGSGNRIIEYYSHRIDDDKETSDGNDDGKVNPGETIELPVTLRNRGASTAHNVEATLSTSSQYITITDDDRRWGDIQSGATDESSDFDFVVSSNCPPGYAIPFTLNITSDEGSWTDTFTVTVYGSGGGGGGFGSPVMAYHGHRIDDDRSTSDGNDDGKVNPGETIELPVTLKNRGASTAHNVEATLTTSSQYITITDDDRGWGDIPAGATDESSDFDFVVSSNCPPGYVIPFTLNITSDEGSWTDTFTVTVYGSGGGGSGVTPGILSVHNDFDGDGRSDLGAYHPSSGEWYIYQSTTGFQQTIFGGQGMMPMTGDFDGDGKFDLATYDLFKGEWRFRSNSGGATEIQMGGSGALPVTGKFDDDLKDDYGVYYPQTGEWNIRNSTGKLVSFRFGFPGTTPVVGDLDGDGIDDVGCYFPPLGGWYFYTSKHGFRTFNFGFDGTVPVIGDLDGDGKDDVGCYHAPSGNWYFYKSKEGFVNFQFGFAGTSPVVGDYDGDGKDDIGCYYPPLGLWFIFMSREGFKEYQFGFEGTVPIR